MIDPPSQPAPLIGITGRRAAAHLIGAPAGFHDAPADIYLEEYASSIRREGGLPVHIPLEIDAEALIQRIDGLIIAGGEDVDPELYGQEREAHTAPGDGLRDQSELALFHAAVAHGVPVLGICRGNQLINVARGGTLVQHLEESEDQLAHFHGDRPRAEQVQEITIDPDSALYDVYGDRALVNSFHHQAVDQLGEGVRVAARASDGVIEAIEVEGAEVIGVQWHPECFAGDPLFARFVTTASHARARRSHTAQLSKEKN